MVLANRAAFAIGLECHRPVPRPLRSSSRPSRARPSPPASSRNVYRAATAGLTPDRDSIPDLVETQPEFTTPIWDYLDKRVTAEAHRAWPGGDGYEPPAVRCSGQGQSGIDPYILGAIWGIETDYGAVLSSKAADQTHHPLAGDAGPSTSVGGSGEDEADFIAALLLVQQGRAIAAHLVGSWAGAIGHLQVNPSNVIAMDRRRRRWQGRPPRVLADALATSAKFLRDLGYAPGVDWGFEVSVPAGFDWLLADRETLRPISFFTERGVARVRGRPSQTRRCRCSSMPLPAATGRSF